MFFGPGRKSMVWTSGRHRPEERKYKFVSFSFIFFNDLTRTSISFPPAGDPNVLGSSNRTNGRPPHGFVHKSHQPLRGVQWFRGPLSPFPTSPIPFGERFTSPLPLSVDFSPRARAFFGGPEPFQDRSKNPSMF